MRAGDRPEDGQDERGDTLLSHEDPTMAFTMTFEKPTEAELNNRFNHHPPVGDQGERYGLIRSAIKQAAIVCVDLTPCSPEQARALNALDEAMMLFNAAIARRE
jgi:hypothetical protein